MVGLGGKRATLALAVGALCRGAAQILQILAGKFPRMATYVSLDHYVLPGLQLFFQARIPHA